MTAPVVSKIVYDAVMAATATKVETSTEQYDRACSELADCWVPKEASFTCRGYRLLYCFNPRTGQHAYIDLGTDMPLTNEEVARVFQT